MNTTTRDELVAALDRLQTWFAGHPCGWRDGATAGQVEQWADREREEADLIERLAAMG